jgi:CheY-like chemotaxis protein
MAATLENITVLVVDDDADTLDLLRSVLEESGASVVTAQSVDDALEAFRQSPPHAVVADIRLGVSDGYALIKAIREFNIEYKGSTPVIAITGYASPDDRERAIAAGFNSYFPKPLNPPDVVAAIRKTLSRPPDVVA